MQEIVDDMREMVPLDVVGNSSRGKGDLAIHHTNEAQDGLQRAFLFYDREVAATWPGNTTFYAQYLSV